MSAKKKYKNKFPQAAKKPIARAPEQQAAGMDISEERLNIILPLAAVIITFFVYRYTLHNHFLDDWDDWIYVQKDPFITGFSLYNLKMMLFHNITRNYYHPLTMLSLALDYSFFQLHPEGYYFTNILIHCANVAVIYFFTKLLLENMSQKYGYGAIKGIPWLAVASALFLGVHPMHVESVAWMAERKDVLYAFFYFLGLLMYIRYINGPGLKQMLWVVVLYGCSLLSKPMAVSFPLSLFAIDFLFKRKDWKNLIIEKWPFFVVSLAGGILVFFTQKESGSIAFLHGFTLLHKLTVPFYSFFMYFVKAFVPFKLCGYYPYPPITTQGYLPLFFYIVPFLAAALVLIPLYISKKGGENYFRVVVFGFGFYFANVVFILQFLSSGVAIMAERYSYVAYFGIFFMVVYFMGLLIQKIPSYKVPVIAATAVYLLVLAYICDGRTKVWHDSETFWHDVIRKYPRQWMVPYMNLGQYYVNKGQMDSAFADYKILAELHSTTSVVYRNLANIYAMHKQYSKSLELYNLALKYDTTGAKGDIYLDKAVTLSIMGRLDSAIANYDHAYAMDSNSKAVLTNRAYTYLSAKQYDLSIRDYDHLIRLDSLDPVSYLRRGEAEAQKGALAAALNDYKTCLGMQPGNTGCMYDMSLAYNALKDYPNALNYAVKAKQAGVKVPDNYISELQKDAGSMKQW